MTANIHEAKTHLPTIVQRMASGEEIMSTESGKPIACIVPFEQVPLQRVPGNAKGKIWIAPDFNTPLPDEMLDAFEGKGL